MALRYAHWQILLFVIVTNAFCTVVNKMEKVPASLKAFYNKAEIRDEMLPLAGFDAIFLEQIHF